MSGAGRNIRLKSNLTCTCLTLQLTVSVPSGDDVMLTQLSDSVIWFDVPSQLVKIKPSRDQGVNCEQLTKSFVLA